jgi:prepilin-type N-terminal cleavage/methylation domain-containing protein
MKGWTDSGVTLVEVLVSTAVASLALAGAAGLLAASARAVADSELETSAVWVASRTIEEWRSHPALALDGQLHLDRDGDTAVGEALFEATWSARPEAELAGTWRVTATVTSPRLRQAVSAEAIVQRVTP